MLYVLLQMLDTCKRIENSGPISAGRMEGVIDHRND